MARRFLFVLCATVLAAQVRQREPFDTATQSFWDARRTGSFDQAAARREELRGLLAQMPVDSPLWVSRVQNVAQIYQGSGRRLQSRAIYQDALTRADALGEWHPTRIQLLN